MKIAIIGFGLEGHVALDHWNNAENDITICDNDGKLKVPSGIKTITGVNYLSDLDQFDLIIRSPGTKPQDIIKANNPEIISKITTSTNEFFLESPSKNIIGVTGTKGKGTTATLISKLIETSGRKVYLAGNIGVPALDLLKENIQKDDWIVLELSSFQLSDLKYSPHIAVCLMVVPEHLNWHKEMDEYITAKGNIFRFQKPDDIAIYFEENPISKNLALLSSGNKLPYYKSPGAEVINNSVSINGEYICALEELKLIGKHNAENVCAAVTAIWQIDQNIESIRSVITNFKGLSHRLELIQKNGINFYNDSFASVPDASIAAFAAIQEPKILIAGGYDRNLNLDGFVESISKDKTLKHVVLIGQSADRVSDKFISVGYANYTVTTTKNLSDVVNLALKYTENGDAIVFSPGFPSFDMFKNFEERGNKFKEVVTNL